MKTAGKARDSAPLDRAVVEGLASISEQLREMRMQQSSRAFDATQTGMVTTASSAMSGPGAQSSAQPAGFRRIKQA